MSLDKQDFQEILSLSLKQLKEDILTELHNEISSVREDLRGEISSVREDLRGEISAVGEDLRGEFRREIAAVEERIILGVCEFMNENILPQFDNMVTKDEFRVAMRRVDAKFDLLTDALVDSDAIEPRRARELMAVRIVH
ncbi:MAG: hypothetical protein HW383_683 [Candidatus Magasanikbacteria bacterium]|nr:hypothetical protein [Candidatus Magasanikbacteria bacterium]